MNLLIATLDWKQGIVQGQSLLGEKVSALYPVAGINKMSKYPLVQELKPEVLVQWPSINYIIWLVVVELTFCKLEKFK